MQISFHGFKALIADMGKPESGFFSLFCKITPNDMHISLFSHMNLSLF